MLFAGLLASVEPDRRAEVRSLMTPAPQPSAPSRARSPLPHKPGAVPPAWWHGEADAAAEAMSARDWLAG